MKNKTTDWLSQVKPILKAPQKPEKAKPVKNNRGYALDSAKSII